MQVVLANLSNKPFEKSRFNLNRSAKKFGIEDIRSFEFERDILSSPFFTAHQSILSQKRGLGYWLWKPYIILEVMKTLQDGDIVIYSDCGIEIIDNLRPLIDICYEKEPVLLFANHNFLNAHFTKRDCFVRMDCDNERYWYSLQCDAAFMLFRKTKFTMHFLNKWMKFCEDAFILTDTPNAAGNENLPGFIDHRHDQSVLSLLAEKYHLNLYRKPSHSCSVVLPLKQIYTKSFFTKQPIIHKEWELQEAYKDEQKNRRMNGNGALVKTEYSEDKVDASTYSYIVSCLNSKYDRLIYHHRMRNPTGIKRIQIKLVIGLIKVLKRAGYRLEKIEPQYA